MILLKTSCSALRAGKVKNQSFADAKNTTTATEGWMKENVADDVVNDKRRQHWWFWKNLKMNDKNALGSKHEDWRWTCAYLHLLLYQHQYSCNFLAMG